MSLQLPSKPLGNTLNFSRNPYAQQRANSLKPANSRVVRTTAAAQNNNNNSRNNTPSIPGLDSKIIQTAIKEPVAFLGGLFAGILALDITQDPLSTWIEQRKNDAGLSYIAAKQKLEQEQKRQQQQER